MLDIDEECMQHFYQETSREEILETLVCRREDVPLKRMLGKSFLKLKLD
jgi:hypothetical protein